MSARVLAAAFVATIWLTVAAFGGGGGFAGLGEQGGGYDEVVRGRGLSFPADLGAHPGYRIEWWYLTANLRDQSGAHYGVQWTLFRTRLKSGEMNANEPGDNFTSPQVWMGHAAVTTKDRHFHAETFARGGIGQAGAQAEPFRAWIDDWVFEGDGALAKAHVSASGEEFSYELSLSSDKPFVLHGDQGYSVKSDRGQASYYFSQPFFRAEGVIRIGDREIAVAGEAWMDREWSSQPLASDQKGWDWFSLHLASGEKVMLFRLRSDLGRDYAAGTWITSDGASAQIANDDITIEPVERAEVAGRVIPTHWNVRIKSRDLEIQTHPLNPRSWMDTSIAYWEGPLSFSGSHSGRGYLEMTGY